MKFVHLHLWLSDNKNVRKNLIDWPFCPTNINIHAIFKLLPAPGSVRFTALWLMIGDKPSRRDLFSFVSGYFWCNKAMKSKRKCLWHAINLFYFFPLTFKIYKNIFEDTLIVERNSRWMDNVEKFYDGRIRYFKEFLAKFLSLIMKFLK